MCSFFSSFLRLLWPVHSHNVYAVSPRAPQKQEHLGSSLTLINVGMTQAGSEIHGRTKEKRVSLKDYEGM